MRIHFYFNKTSDELIGIDSTQLPYTYLRSYYDFLKKTCNADIIFALAPDENIFIVMSYIKGRFINNIQLLSEPFRACNPVDTVLQGNFLTALITELVKRKIGDRIIAPPNFIVFGDCPRDSVKCNFGTYLIDLTLPTEVLYANLHPKHRNVIRNAEKKGVVLQYGLSQLKIFYDLYQKTMSRSNLHYMPYSYFETLCTSLGENNLICGVTYWNKIPECALLMPYTYYGAYYLFGAAVARPSVTGAMNYLHWETMKFMKSNNVQRYDLVGARLSDVSNTKLGGIQNFKKRLGGHLKKGYLFKKDLSIFKCRVYDSLVFVKREITRSKSFKDIIDQEIEKDSSQENG